MPVSPIPQAKIPRPPSRLSYLYQRTETHHHRGIDLVAPIGTEVWAAESGRVEVASTVYRRGFSGYGRVIVIKGVSGRWFLYGHLDQVFVSPGQAVLEGQPIGTVGNTAFTKADPTARGKGPHLHFEVSPRPYPQPSEAPRIDPLAFLFPGTGAAAAAFLALVLLLRALA